MNREKGESLKKSTPKQTVYFDYEINLAHSNRTKAGCLEYEKRSKEL
jgi:hypothetical protein